MNEKQTARKVGYVSAMCAAIGVFLGWGAKMQFDLGWWIVPIVALGAGSLAWLMYDLAGVLAGVKQVLREVTGWKPDWQRVARFFKVWLYGSLGFTGLASLFVGPIVIALLHSQGLDETVAPDLKPSPFKFAVPVVALVLVISSFFAIMWGADTPEELRSSIALKSSRKFALYFNPISLPFTAVYFLAKGLIWVAPRIPRATMVVLNGVCRFVVISFVLIHNDERRICFTATGLGTAIGLITCYQHGNAFFGAVIGGAVGGVLGYLESGWGKRLASKLAARWLKESAI